MIEFFQELLNPSMNFLLYATIIGILSSFAFGTMGTFVVIRRISFIAGAISHCTLGGIGFGLYATNVWGLSWLTPQVGSIIMALISAITIGIFSIYYKQREDTLIGSLWAFGMALGLILIHYTPGYIDPMSYLFGSILMINKTDLLTVTLLDIIILSVTIIFYNKFVAISFDEEFARLRGIKTKNYYILLLALISLTIVMLINIVGIVMIIALLTIPSGTAGIISKNIKGMIIYSIAICMLTIILGLSISYSIDAPSGPVIIILNSILYLCSMIFFKKQTN